MIKKLLICVAVFGLSGCLESDDDLIVMKEAYCKGLLPESVKVKLILAIKKRIEAYPEDGICGKQLEEIHNGN